MKYTAVLVMLALIVATVQAVALGNTNAERMARGLPPRAPRKLYRSEATGTSLNKAPKPSSKPGSCSTGPAQCCEQLVGAENPIASVILGLLGIILGPDVVVGLECSPISVIGIGSGSCSSNAVCCQNNNVGGLISIGCIAIVL